jgi:hypothetical protein
MCGEFLQLRDYECAAIKMLRIAIEQRKRCG